MSSHVFHEVFLHLVWHTKGSRPFLTASMESSVHNFLRDRIGKTRGSYLHGIGGTANHVHLAINIEPFVTISDLVGDMKGACSREINKMKRQQALQWQRGFGVVSFGKKQLPWVLKYIAGQKEHHAGGTVQRRLEQVTSDDDGSPLPPD